MFLGGFDPGPPPPGYRVYKRGLGCLRRLSMHFGKNFIKQKLQGTPDLVGGGHLFGSQF